MAPTGGIAGRVRDGDGEPMAHARVQVMESFNEEGDADSIFFRLRRRTISVNTDSSGCLLGLTTLLSFPRTHAGAVLFRYSRRGHRGHREDVIAPVIVPRIAPNGETTEETYVSVYYPTETDPSRAQPVQVQPGSSTSGVDFVLSRGKVRSYHIRGTARNLVTESLREARNFALHQKSGRQQ
jgi:hypothetical protein